LSFIVLSDLKEFNQTAALFMGFHSVISNKPRLHTKKPVFVQ